MKAASKIRAFVPWLLLMGLGAHAATPASRALDEGRLDEAIGLLKQQTAANPHDGPAQLLLCRAQYAYEHYDDAVRACEAATANGLGKDSDALDWLGRAYGGKAEHSNVFSQMGLAKHVRQSFEAAVEANPRNANAVDDLSEYYVNAPSAFGGGAEKALALATRVEAAIPVSAHRIRAMLADKHNDPATAEKEYRAAAAADPKAAGPQTDLARFLFKHKQPDAGSAALHKAVALDTAHGPATADVASILLDEKRELPFAAQCALQYLSSGAKSDGAPTPRVHVLLARIALAGGDKAKARTELTAALNLASDYGPAKKQQGNL